MLFNKFVAFCKDGHRVAEAMTYLALLGFLLVAAVPAFAQSGSVYGDRSAQVLSNVTRAVVLQTRVVHVEPQNQDRYAGAAAGAALDDGIGAYLGRKSNAAQAVLGVVGASLGGLAGSKAANSWGSDRAMEYVVQVINTDGSQGPIYAITQPDPGEILSAGDPVYLLSTAGTMRVVRAQHQLVPAPAQQRAPTSDPAASRPMFHVDYQLSGRF